jgi:hypothetical protein
VPNNPNLKIINNFPEVLFPREAFVCVYLLIYEAPLGRRRMVRMDGRTFENYTDI